MNRPPITKRTISDLPWSFDEDFQDAAFVLGIANSSWPHPSGIAYKYLKWARYSVRKRIPISKINVENFVNRKVAEIKMANIKKVHTIAIFRLTNGVWTLELRS